MGNRCNRRPNCKFLHEDDFEQKPRKHDQPRFEKKASDRFCRHGSKCFDLKKGICRFKHSAGDYEFIEDKRNVDMPGSGDSSFVPSEANSNKASLLKTKLRRWSRLDDEDQIKKAVRINEVAAILEDPDLVYRDYANLFRVLQKVLDLQDANFKSVFSSQFIKKGFLQDGQVVKLRTALVQTPRWNERQQIGEVVPDVLTLWRFVEFVLETLPRQVDLVHTNYLSKFTKQIIKFAKPFTDLCLDEEEEILSARLSQLEDLAIRVSSTRQLLFEDRQKTARVQTTPSKFSTPKLLVENDKKVWNPPGDFRGFPDYPSTGELTNESPVYLTQNVVDGSYQSVQHYLDVHYRLLREDFISSAKSGLRLHYKNQRLKMKAKNFDLTLYQSVRVVKYEMTKVFSGLRLRIKRGGAAKSVKKLMFGSMVLLSKDRFAHFFVGIIRHKNDKKNEETLKKYGYLEAIVEVVNSEESLVEQYQLFKDREIEMLESTCYFEAYFYVLRALKNLRDFPLAPMIVQCDPRANSTPNYLRDMAPFIAQKIGQIPRLDPSQEAALASTFRSKLAIIQGPPGTGKTFVGVQIMRILLELKREHKILGAPILVVCYTNHALDQFLGHVLGFTQKVCRLGGRTKDEGLRKFSMRELLNHNFTRKNSTFYQVKDLQRDLIQKFNWSTSVFFEMENLRVVHPGCFKIGYETDLIDVLDRRYRAKYASFCESIANKKKRKQFQEFFIRKTKDVSSLSLLYWLGLLDFDYVHGLFKDPAREDPTPNSGSSEDEAVQDRRAEEAEAYQYDLKNASANDSENQRIEGILRMHPLSDFFSQGRKTLQGQINEIFREYNLKNLDGSSDGQFSEFEKSFSSRELFDLDYPTRWGVNVKLIRRSLAALSSDVRQKTREIRELDDKMKAIEAEQHLSLANLLDVVAMTTTGACKYKPLLSRLQSKVILIEEAAEVLEAQIVTSMSPAIEHMVLIGDHQQLRPAVNSYRLAKDFHLEVSLFERLVKNNFRNSLLSQQRRMRPEVSDLVRLIYPSLKDHPSVLNRKDIKGVPKNVFFFSHSNQESSTSNSGSKYNEFEAKMIVAFADYLVKQGYRTQSITILSLYLGQLLFLKDFVKKNKSLDGVLIKTVDNYQGEENEIIILSLVRSNKKNNIGFLKVSNRVCVALSRARRGMFIFGDVKVLRNASESKEGLQTPRLSQKKQEDYSTEASQKEALWIRVIRHLKQQKAILNTIQLKCQTHGVTNVIKAPGDFQKIPGGGCTQMCGTRLDCGHVCKQVCHPLVKASETSDGHEDYRCLQPCKRQRPCGHACSYKCYECKDGHRDCMEVVRVKYPCNHVNVLKCFFYQQNKGKCMVKCDRLLECGHQCKKPCFEDCRKISKELRDRGFKSPCKVPVKKELPCGHSVEVPCGQGVEEFVKHENHKCSQKCGHELEDCKHLCQRECHKCAEDYFHAECAEKCGDLLICNHTCVDACTGKHERCPPCQKDCEVRCTHSKCPKQCGEVCAPCVEPCENRCPHSKCTKLCHEPCDRLPCLEPCPKKLGCGHDCVGLCGDVCPPVCRVCDKDDETFSIFFGNEGDPGARFVFLPDCGHSIERRALDKYFEMKGTEERRRIEYIKCPKCSSSIKNCLRYQNVIKSTHASVNKIKKMTMQNLRILKDMHIDPQMIKDLEKAVQTLTRKGGKAYIKQSGIRKELESVFRQIQENEDFAQRSNRVASVHISTISTSMQLFWDVLNTMKTHVVLFRIRPESFKSLGFFLKNLRERRLSQFKLKELNRMANAFDLFFRTQEALVKYNEVKHLDVGRKREESRERVAFLERFQEHLLREKYITPKRNIEECVKVLQKLDLTQMINFRKEIVKAIGLKKGHWFECPNGHPYVIGECGGANQVARCPECSATIGGSNHALASGNRHASQWDESSRPAWDERNGEAFARHLQDMIDRGEID